MITWKIIPAEVNQTLKQNGPFFSLREEWCSQAFQQAHAIRAMLAGYRIKPIADYLSQARSWAEMTLRLQGTHGHPDQYNMGYGYRIRDGIPEKWFVADCGTEAVTLLDVASFLKETDPLRKSIIESVCRFSDYIIEHWTLPDGSFSLGYYDFECLNKTAYHCANAQSNLFLWPLAAMTGNPRYRQQALATTKWMANWDGYGKGYYGDMIHNCAYNGESLMVSLAYLGKGEEKLKKQILNNIEKHIVSWGVKNFGQGWFTGNKYSHAKDPLVLMALKLAQPQLKKNAELSRVIKHGYDILRRTIEGSWKAVQRHDVSGMAIAIYVKPDELKDRITLPKYFVSDGLSGMALAVEKQSDSLFPLSHFKRGE